MSGSLPTIVWVVLGLLGIAAFLGFLALLAFLATQAARQAIVSHHCHGYCDHDEIFRDHETTHAAQDARITKLESAIATQDAYNATRDQTLDAFRTRLGILENAPRTVTQVNNHYYERITSFNWISALIGGLVGLVAGIITVVFLSGHKLTIAGTEYHYGWALHQLPLNVITVALFMATVGVFAGWVWHRTTNRWIAGPPTSTTTVTTQP